MHTFFKFKKLEEKFRRNFKCLQFHAIKFCPKPISANDYVGLFEDTDGSGGSKSGSNHSCGKEPKKQYFTGWTCFLNSNEMDYNQSKIMWSIYK